MRISMALVLASMLVAAPAAARDVYLNGVKLGSDVVIKNQTFPACEVQIDDKGDVHITAKGFKIDVAPAKGAAGAGGTGQAGAKPATPPAAADAKLEKRYWLISRQPRRGQAQYDVDVFVNGKFVKKVRSADEPVILEITRFVRPGDNVVELVATKNMGDKRLSSSPTDTLEIILGEGNAGGGTVSITKALVSYTRTAQETQGFTDKQTFPAR